MNLVKLQSASWNKRRYYSRKDIDNIVFTNKSKDMFEMQNTNEGTITWGCYDMDS